MFKKSYTGQPSSRLAATRKRNAQNSLFARLYGLKALRVTKRRMAALVHRPVGLDDLVLLGTFGEIEDSVRPVKALIDKIEEIKIQRVAGGEADLGGHRDVVSNTQAELQKVEQEQLGLYRDVVLERVEKRFTSKEAAAIWFDTGNVPGFNSSADQMVRKGLAAQVIEAINAIEAGVYA